MADVFGLLAGFISFLVVFMAMVYLISKVVARKNTKRIMAADEARIARDTQDRASIANNEAVDAYLDRVNAAMSAAELDRIQAERIWR